MRGKKKKKRTFRTRKTKNKNMFDSRRVISGARFSTISFAAVLLMFILAGSFIFNFSLHSAAVKDKNSQPRELHSFADHGAKPRLKPGSIPQQPLSVKAEEEIEETKKSPLDVSTNLAPISDSADEDRIAGGLSEKVRPIEIFQPTELTRRFHGREREFFGHDHGEGQCKIRFFMTWIAPASSFGPREFLAVESLFKTNPNACLLILSGSMDSDQGRRILNPLLDRGYQVVATTPDLPALLKNTPAGTWFDDISNGARDPGEIPLAQNLSNLMRLAILYKYGGVYVDTDFITLKDFSNLRNSIGAQSIDASGNWTRLNNAVLVFDKGHPLLYMFMEEFASTFDGNKWGHNGPYLVSRVIERIMSTETGPDGCEFTVLPPSAFYPVDWTRIAGFFTKPIDRARSKWVEAKLRQLVGETYGLHLWNRQSSRLRIEEGSIIGRLAEDHCVICKQIYSY